MHRVCRTVISILLMVSLLSVSVSALYTGGSELRLTVVSDTHFQCFSDVGELSDNDNKNTDGMINSDLYYYASNQGQMNYESKAIVKQLLSSFVSGTDDYLLIAGDLTCGKRQSHIEFAEMLKDAERLSGKEIFVICGNHDCDDDNFEKYIGLDEFKKIYADFGYNQAVNVHDDSGSYTVDLDDNYRLIAIDSCVYGEDDGKINESVMEWIRQQNNEAQADGKKLIGMMHHSILPHFYVQPMIKNYTKFAEKFADMGIKYMFTGHIHANDISSATTKAENTIYDVQTGSLITSPNAFRHVSFGDKVQITSEYINKINVSDLPDGYSAKQLAKIEDNFSEYAYGFFEAGMYRWINKNLCSAEKIGRLLKLNADSQAYKELDSLMKTIGESVNLPIYDDGSIESFEKIAEEKGYRLPDSNYLRIYQIVAKLMGNFYLGDGKNVAVSDSDIDLLYNCIKLSVAHFIKNQIHNGSVKELLDFLKIQLSTSGVCEGQECIKSILSISDKLTQAILMPLLDGIVNDYSAPDDVTAILDGYNSVAAKENSVPLDIFLIILRYFEGLIKCLVKVFIA